MKQEEYIKALYDIHTELKLYCSTRSEVHLSQTVLKLEDLISKADYTSFLNTIKRAVYTQMTQSQGEENKRLYNQYQALKTATSFDEIMKIIE